MWVPNKCDHGTDCFWLIVETNWFFIFIKNYKMRITKNCSSIWFFRWCNNFLATGVLRWSCRSPGLFQVVVVSRLWKLIIQVLHEFFLGRILLVFTFDFSGHFIRIFVGFQVWLFLNILTFVFRRLINDNKWSKISNKLVLIRFNKSPEIQIWL